MQPKRIYEPLNGTELNELIESKLEELRAQISTVLKPIHSFPEVRITCTVQLDGNIVEKQTFKTVVGPILQPDIVRDELGLEIPIQLASPAGTKQSKTLGNKLRGKRETREKTENE